MIVWEAYESDANGLLYVWINKTNKNIAIKVSIEYFKIKQVIIDIVSMQIQKLQDENIYRCR